MPRATKCGRLMTHNEDVPPITSHDLSVTWSCEVTLQIKYAIPPLPQDQSPPSLARW